MGVSMIGCLVILSFYVAVSSACGGTFHDLSGTFTSPNYPSKYTNNQKCVYKFNTGYPVTITCQSFVLQSKNRKGICKDFFKIVDSGTKTTYCGTDAPTDYTSTATVFKVLFKSNGKKVFSGFSCTYDSVVEGTTSTTTTTPTTTTTTTPTTTTTTPTTTTTTPTTTTTTTTPTTITTTPTTTTTTTPSTTTTTPTTTTTTTTTPTTTTTTTTTTTAATTAMPDLLQNALTAVTDGDTCSTTQQNTCGCSEEERVSGYYTTSYGDYRIIAATGIPDHSFEHDQQVVNPNQACQHKCYMAVPFNPTKGSNYKSYRLGPVGLASSGAFFYNHLSSPEGGVAVVSEGATFDSCNGHSDGNCRYHYHDVPNCIAGASNCSHVGYMRDGFPVYTYCTHESEDRYLKSCYFLIDEEDDGSNASHYEYDETAYDNGDCDLDQANGYTFSDSRGYAYIFTEDYPFIMAGYYGTELSNICYMYD